jgi:hypothetical protein
MELGGWHVPVVQHLEGWGGKIANLGEIARPHLKKTKNKKQINMEIEGPGLVSSVLVLCDFFLALSNQLFSVVNRNQKIKLP